MRSLRLVACTFALTGLLSVPIPQQAVASSAKVAGVQVALKALGLYPVAVDGVRGPFTRRGVVMFQRRRGLIVDGVVGPQTRRALGRLGRPRLGSRVMRRGHLGWDVAALQFLLARRGFSPGAVDGDFGQMTQAALTAYQRAAGLTVDGLAGSATIAALRNRSSGPSRAPSGPVRFYRPVSAAIGDRFGAPREGNRRHSGLDFRAGRGMPIHASGVGTIVFAGFNTGGYGNLIVVQHRLGYTTWYAHMSRVIGRVGQRVSGGTRLGLVGSTGNSTGPHLHWEVRLNNVPIDPISYLLAGTAAGAGSSGRTTVACSDPAAYGSATIDACR